jgi:hypothetical protein
VDALAATVHGRVVDYSDADPAGAALVLDVNTVKELHTAIRRLHESPRVFMATPDMFMRHGCIEPPAADGTLQSRHR